MKCNHQWVAGIAIVHSEDVEQIAKKRKVVCGKCDVSYNHKIHKEEWQ
jgi:hypothetical protein